MEPLTQRNAAKPKKRDTARRQAEPERVSLGVVDGGAFYRIVRHDPPTVGDFQSDREAGRPRPSNPELARLWEGRSMFRTEAQARAKARAFPFFGRIIARITVPRGSTTIRVERTFPRSRGHHTVWGDAAELHALVDRTVPV